MRNRWLAERRVDIQETGPQNRGAMRRALADTPNGQLHYRALLVCGTEDPFSSPRLVDQMPEAFAAAVRGSLRGGP